MRKFERISFNPAVLSGKACVRGMRVSVSTVLGLLSAGHSTQRILAYYPYLEAEDIPACLEYAAWLVQQRVDPSLLEEMDE